MIPLRRNRHILRRHALEHARITQPLHRIQNLDSRKSPLKVGGNAFAKMLGRPRGILEAYVERIHISIVW